MSSQYEAGERPAVDARTHIQSLHEPPSFFVKRARIHKNSSLQNVLTSVGVCVCVCYLVVGESGVTTSPPRSRAVPSFL